MPNSAIQSILFDRSHWKLSDAKEWLKQRNMKTDVDMKSNTYRFRQREPKHYYEYFTYTLPHIRGIKLVIITNYHK